MPECGFYILISENSTTVTSIITLLKDGVPNPPSISLILGTLLPKFEETSSYHHRDDKPRRRPLVNLLAVSNLFLRMILLVPVVCSVLTLQSFQSPRQISRPGQAPIRPKGKPMLLGTCGNSMEEAAKIEVSSISC
jgi:hypothetical protein